MPNPSVRTSCQPTPELPLAVQVLQPEYWTNPEAEELPLRPMQLLRSLVLETAGKMAGRGIAHYLENGGSSQPSSSLRPGDTFDVADWPAGTVVHTVTESLTPGRGTPTPQTDEEFERFQARVDVIDEEWTKYRGDGARVLGEVAGKMHIYRRDVKFGVVMGLGKVVNPQLFETSASSIPADGADVSRLVSRPNAKLPMSYENGLWVVGQATNRRHRLERVLSTTIFHGQTSSTTREGEWLPPRASERYDA